MLHSGSGSGSTATAGTPPLPSGASTAANQATEIASLASIDAGIPAALGQTTAANSMPVVLASNQPSITVAQASSSTIVYEDITTVARGTVIAVGSFTTVYTYSGAGLLHSFSIGIGTGASNWLVRLVIDGTNEVFGAAGLLTDDMNAASIYNFPSIAQSPLPGLNFIASASNLQWAAPNNSPIKYSTSVSILLKRLVSTKTFNGGVVVLTK